jgi:hypothetical protein
MIQDNKVIKIKCVFFLKGTWCRGEYFIKLYNQGFNQTDFRNVSSINGAGDPSLSIAHGHASLQ